MPRSVVVAAGGGGEEEEDEDERDEPAEVAERPAGAGDAADLAARAEAGQHGVGEDLAELGADEGEGVDDEDDAAGRGMPGVASQKPSAAEDVGHREGEDPALARAGAVGHGAEERGEDARPIAPPIAAAAPQSAWPRDRVADDLGDEVGGEDEGDDQRLERLVGPVEEHPGEDAAAVGGRSRCARQISGGQGRSASAALQAATQAGERRAARGRRARRAPGRSATMPPASVTAPRKRPPESASPPRNIAWWT